MNVCKLVIALACAAFLSACSTTVPVLMQNSSGLLLRGEATASLSGGTFYATNGKLKCDGTYDAWDTSATITMQVRCNDGRSGTIMATRDSNMTDGHGRMRLNDGTEANFVFGAPAENH